MEAIDKTILEKANKWLETQYDLETREKVKFLIENDTTELTESFYRDLEFGTGGLRGIMGVGTNRMNKYTVGMATQGFANYILKMFPDKTNCKIAIAYDSRNNSKYFAQITADVMSANGIKVFLFEDLRPTPELSFAIRELNCQSGVVITASHNPKEYNGYKAYWEDGGQLTSPHDTNVIDEVIKITDISQVKFNGNPQLIEMIGENIDKIYLANVKSLSLSPELIKKHKDLSIVYTALHGTGITLVPRALKELGFENIHIVKEQAIVDGNFPTIKSPNPEEKAALEMAIEEARKVNASLVLATDPDADRVGIAVKNDKGEYVLFNGNQTASVLIYYLINQWKAKGKLTSNEYIVKTIVTSELLKDIALKNDVASYDVLTGFKYIAELILKLEGKQTFIGGGEESYGYLVGDFVRDKDAVISCCMIAEMAAWAAENGKTFYDILIDLYTEYGFYKEDLLSITKKGKSGAEEIQAMMNNYRSQPPTTINGAKVTMIKDYKLQTATDYTTNITSVIDLPKSNVLQFFTADGSKITVRPSGTEPKIKFYFGVKELLSSKADYEKVNQQLNAKIKAIIEDMKL
ncbi:MAG: phospho-sugar mutase [Bacteroidetes bacterium]|nr:phospho-sugar mutase [Bacteroidota bacterium]